MSQQKASEVPAWSVWMVRLAGGRRGEVSSPPLGPVDYDKISELAPPPPPTRLILSFPPLEFY